MLSNFEPYFGIHIIIILRYMYTMSMAMLEPISAGLIVALINRSIISNNNLFDYCKSNTETITEHDDSVSSSSITSTDAIEVHTHF